jgi:hypothetical protein
MEEVFVARIEIDEQGSAAMCLDLKDPPQEEPPTVRPETPVELVVEAVEPVLEKVTDPPAQLEPAEVAVAPEVEAVPEEPVAPMPRVKT